MCDDEGGWGFLGVFGGGLGDVLKVIVFKL